MAPGSALIPLAEDHLAGRGLQDGGDGDVDGLANHFARIIDYDHGSVIEVGDALVKLFAFFQDEYPHDFTGQNDGLERVGQFVDIEHGHALQLRDFVQIEIVGQNLAVINLGEFDQLHIDFADAGKVVFHNLNLHRSRFLQALQNVEAASSAIAFKRVGGIGYELQFAEHKLRNDNESIEESGLGDVGDAAVDNHAGVEDLVTLRARFFAAEDSAEGGEVEQISLVRADRQSYVGHDQHDHDLQEALERAGGDAIANDEGEEIGADDAQHAAESGAQQAGEAYDAQSPLENYDGRADEQADSNSGQRGQAEGVYERADYADNDDK